MKTTLLKVQVGRCNFQECGCSFLIQYGWFILSGMNRIMLYKMVGDEVLYCDLKLSSNGQSIVVHWYYLNPYRCTFFLTFNFVSVSRQQLKLGIPFFNYAYIRSPVNNFKTTTLLCRYLE